MVGDSRKAHFLPPAGPDRPGCICCLIGFVIFFKGSTPAAYVQDKMNLRMSIGIRDHGHFIFKKRKNALCLIPWENGYNERFNGTRGPHFMLQWRYTEVFEMNAL